jgi:hypothetical protein
MTERVETGVLQFKGIGQASSFAVRRLYPTPSSCDLPLLRFWRGLRLKTFQRRK